MPVAEVVAEPASIRLVAMSVRNDVGRLVLTIPAPAWGPAVALATYAYYRRRTSLPGAPGSEPA